MPKRKGKRGGPRRRKSLPAFVTAPGDGNTPGELEWQNMIEASSITVDVFEECAEQDDQDNGHDSDSMSTMTTVSGTKLRGTKITFKLNDDAILNSDENDTSNAWIGRIVGIRKRPQEQDAWIKILWYYSGSDIADLLPEKQVKRRQQCLSFAPYERAISTVAEIQSVRTLLAPTYVHEFDERELYTPDLRQDTFFVRSIFNLPNKRIEHHPDNETCICCRAYVPFQMPSESPGSDDQFDDQSMRFCPRPSCRKWYHNRCLLSRGFIDRDEHDYCGDRGVRLVAGDPDIDEDCPILEWAVRRRSENDMDVDGVLINTRASTAPSTSSEDTAPFSGSHGHLLSLSEVLHESGVPESILAHLPASLFYAAASPIVRRPGPPSHGWSPLGNVNEVVLARRMIYTALEHDKFGIYYLEKVEALVAELNDAKNLEVEAQVNGADEGTIADSEFQVIQDICNKVCLMTETPVPLLASPYIPYWTKREGELKGAAWAWEHEPLFVCPNCTHAI